MLFDGRNVVLSPGISRSACCNDVSEAALHRKLSPFVLPVIAMIKLEENPLLPFAAP
jgi:hypothetical protein